MTDKNIPVVQEPKPVLMMINTGEEIICKVQEERESAFMIKDPYVVLIDEQNNYTMIRRWSMLTEFDVFTLNKSALVSVNLNLRPDILKLYESQIQYSRIEPDEREDLIRAIHEKNVSLIH